MTELKPGPELDALVAEKVMKCREILAKPDGPIALYRAEEYLYEDPKPYSTSIACAWEVVEKIRLTLDPIGRQWRPTIQHCGSKYRWRCEFELENDNAGDDTTMYFAEADSASLAICLAALAAVGYKQSP